MALAVRELELVIIAKDRASSVVARVGGAMAILGGSIAAMGMRWGRELSQMTREAVDFSNIAALAFTQMFDKGEATVDDVAGVLERVAKQVPRPVEEMGEALFDIFSSLDVNIPEAEKILKRVSQAAVAGQTDVRSAMIPTIAVMNAYGKTADDIDEILDIQFKTVQKGILTYQEFTSNVGKIIPAGVQAGQTFNQVAAAYAFATRQGLNAAMASTSVARAMELIARPKSVKGLEKFGITVRDATGEFLPLADIVAQLGRAFEGMTKPEQRQAFEEIFGTARIQARRFFDVAIPNWREFQALSEEFQDSSGAMQAAFDVMFAEPRAQIDLLKNRIEILRVEIGQRFLPVLTDKLLPAANDILGRWDDLSEGQKDQVANFLGIGSASTIAFGSLTSFAGIVLLTSRVWSGFAKVLGPTIKLLGKTSVVGAAIGVVGWLIWKNWDKLVAFWNSKVFPALKRFWKFLQPLVEGLIRFTKSQAERVWKSIRAAWERLLPVLKDMWARLDLDQVVAFFKRSWGTIKDIVIEAFAVIREAIRIAADFIIALVEGLVSGIKWIWDNFGTEIQATVQFIWDAIVAIVGTALEVIKGILKTAAAFLRGDWEGMWQGLKDIAKAIWDGIVELFKALWQLLVDITGGKLETVASLVREGWTVVKDFFVSTWNSIVEFFQGIWNSDIVTFIRDVLGILRELIRIGIEGIVVLIRDWWRRASDETSTWWGNIKDSLKSVWEAIKAAAGFIWETIKQRIAGPMSVVVRTLGVVWSGVKPVLSRIWNTIKQAAGFVWNQIKSTILTPVQGIIDGIRRMRDLVVGYLRGLWESARSWARRIREALEKISPLKWNSPPVTAVIESGLKAMDKLVVGSLQNIHKQVRMQVNTIRDAMSEMQTPMSLRVPTPALATAGPATTNNIEIYTRASDPQQIADELSWRLRIS